MRARVVPKDQLPEIKDEDWIDRTRRPYTEGDIAWVPVREGLAYTREIPERHRYTGRGFFMLGNVAVCHGKRPPKKEVDEIVSFRHPHGVLWIDAVEDVTRTPKTEVLWGDVGEVCHRESGYVYYLNPREVMFAQGNRNEKMRMARLIRDSPVGERVADMFAGIGYFTIRWREAVPWSTQWRSTRWHLGISRAILQRTTWQDRSSRRSGIVAIFSPVNMTGL